MCSSGMFEEVYLNTPPEYQNTAYYKSRGEALPEKSRKTYETAYENFTKWMKEKDLDEISEDVMLTYFRELGQTYKPSSLWAKYSMLRSMLQFHLEINMENYKTLLGFLKERNVGYETKKSKIFSVEEMKTFLSMAPNDRYLVTKVVLIFGVSGTCRTSELLNLTVEDVIDNQDYILITVQDLNNKMNRQFTVEGPFAQIVREYIALRPPKVATNRFFLNYRYGKCVAQVIGKNKLGAMATEIATFLKLDDPEQYTGYALRKSSASLSADQDGRVTTMKRLSGWLSTTVTESYIDDVINNKRKSSTQVSDIPNLVDGNLCESVMPRSPKRIRIKRPCTAVNSNGENNSTNISDDLFGNNQLWNQTNLNQMDTRPEDGFATKAIHAGQNPHQWSHCSVVPPIVMSTTFCQDGPSEHHGYVYGRGGNPSRNCLEKCLAALENAKNALVFSSGLGTVTALMSLLKSGDHIVSGDDIYGGTNRLFQKCLPRQNISVSFINSTDTDIFVSSIKSNTKMIWLESPTNPLLKITDIKAISEKVKSTRPDIYIVVDNTFVTCYYQRPLELGADISMYSLTKYMNGHSDIIMGAAITNREDVFNILKFNQNALGIVPSPYDCALVNRSLKTLELRMQQHMKNGLAVAKFLESHPFVSKVFHPFLPSHPQHELAVSQMSGHSGMVSFYINGDSVKFLKALRVFMLAESLGGYESLAQLPSQMAHRSVPEDEKIKLGINDQLVRLSVGLETEKDLIADLDQALNSAADIKNQILFT